ncbi:histidine kinase [Maribacter algarum]|uniref:Histidine kinase n=1 Tax=Maribacter algarum (ex Zhang et al. 2020) TaxID=2578118 RepID=A0A5S3PWB0_9FLAO|nr:histidine kinase [Maribacter algarum]TMM57288.1 histidine kinase [Maribacter algarum]
MKKQSLLDKVFQKRWLQHLLFWAGLSCLFTVMAALNTGTIRPHLITNLAFLPAQILAAYVFNYYQLPQLLYKKKYLFFGLSLLVSIYVFSALGRISIVHIVEPFIRTDFVQESITEILSDTGYLFSVYFTSTYICAFIMMLIKAVKTRFEEKQRVELLQQEKVKNELRFLKGQIQPHFLFNTLNNLYALTLSKSDLAPVVVLKLSDLLDFILYQSNQSSIPISKEIELIQGFIELETLRYGDKITIDFAYNTPDTDIQIPPLLLLPLVENAFKHGVSGSMEKARIKIDLKATSNLLSFEIFNTKTANVAPKIQEGKGIGTVNLRRQLALAYPDNHTLDIEETKKSYCVRLSVNLNTELND